MVGIHPEAETQALETALLKRRTWERDLDAPEHLRDVMRQQFRGTAPAFPDPEVNLCGKSYPSFIIFSHDLVILL